MLHQLEIVHDWTATIAHGAAMCAGVVATRYRLDTPGVSIGFCIRRFSEEK